VKNKPPDRPALGPRAAEEHPRPVLSASRAAVLQAVQAGPSTLAALSTATGLHANTLREHLEALTQDHLVRRKPAPPHGRGRPAWLYEVTAATRTPAGAEYAGLAAALAAVLHRTSASPWADAVSAGTAWGGTLARARLGSRPADPASAREEVVELLADLRFAPETEQRPDGDGPDDGDEVVRLTRCPLLDAAKEHPDVVCGVHLGIVRGALQEHGADPDGSTLLPFAEPGCCRLTMRR
jgi:predicted ArsR family transcriptional regulator